jgi:hypothetical protein
VATLTSPQEARIADMILAMDPTERGRMDIGANEKVAVD